MEEYIYKIGIRRKVPYLISGPEYIVTDNTDYRVELSPDEEWEDFPAKSFIYAFDNGKMVVDPITGNTGAIPMVPGNAGKLHFGVSAGEMHTTTWLTIPVRGSVRRKGGVEVPPPTPDQYDKIMDMLNKVMGQVGGGKYPVEIFTEPASFDLDGNITYQVVMVLSDKTRLTAKLPSMGLTLTDVTQYGTTDPTSNTAGMTRQFYVNTVTGEMWTCTDGGEQSTTEWRKLGRKMVLSGSKDPTKEVVEGEVDQLYVNTDTGAIYICTFASNGPMWYEWEWKQIGGTGGSGDVGTDITLGITGAVVGQTVKITEVDENGKPVKWESADIPAQTDIDSTLSIEGAAADAKAVGDKVTKLSGAIENLPQPDWNQNDETAPDYVKNRPFYEETKEVWNYDEAVELSNWSGIEMTDLIKQNFVEGSIVKVLINGETYICTVYKLLYFFCVGNGSLTPASGEDTGEPFAICFDGMATTYNTSNNSDIVNFAIDITVPKPIPGQYLPTGDNCPYVEKSDFNINDYNKFYAQKNELLKWLEIARIAVNYNNTISIGNFDTVGHSEKLEHTAVPENISICDDQYKNKSNVPYIRFSLSIGNGSSQHYNCKVPMTLVYDYMIGTNNIDRKKFTGNFITPEYYLFALVLDFEQTKDGGTTTTMTLKRII